MSTLGVTFGVLGVLLWGVVAAVTLSGSAPFDQTMQALLIVSVLPMLLAAFLLRHSLNHEAHDPIVLALELHPERILELGFHYEDRNGVHVHMARVRLLDGTTTTFPVPPEHLATSFREIPARHVTLHTFSGVFLPVPGASTDLEGRGVIDVQEEVLVLETSRVRSGLARLASLGIASTMTLAFVLFVFELDLPWLMDDLRLPLMLAVAVALGTYLGASALLVRALPRASVVITVPWSLVQMVKLEEEAVVLQTVHPACTGLSRFRTDHPEVLAAACAYR